MRLPTSSEIREGAGYVLINFATPIAFYFTFRWYGAKPAISLAMGVTLIQVLAHWLYALKFSPFFLVASGFTVFFGGMDLLVSDPQFYRFAPFVENVFLGGVFFASIFTRVPLVTHFAQALPAKIRPNLSESARIYLRNLTLIWAIYLSLKGFLFLYLAFRVDLGELIVLRSVIGGITLTMMFVGELVYRKWFRRMA